MRRTIGEADLLENHKPLMHRHVIALGARLHHSGVMDLAGKLLIAMPGMGDPRFAHAVILVCAHSPEGSMGLILNKPAPDLSFAGLLDQIGIPKGHAGRDIRVVLGGPVERGRGFVLHSQDYAGGQATMRVEGGYGMTATLDVLEAIAKGRGPETALLALGYSGWGPGQLETEIARNDWLTADAASELVFSPDDSGKWTAALRRMGIDPITLSSTAGRA
jgi:putative transcriptional regulator